MIPKERNLFQIEETLILDISIMLTYKGFELPATFSALFGESDIRHYNANWMASDTAITPYP